MFPELKSAQGFINDNVYFNFLKRLQPGKEKQPF